MTTKHPQTARKGVTFNLENNTTLEYTPYKAKKQKTRKRGKINKKKEGETLKILYANTNGILGKIRSLQVVANLTNSHVITLTETKSTPPNLEGYAPWITKNRKGKTGGVAIATRQDITNNTQVVDDLEDHDQEILWIQSNKSKHKKMFIGVYYGKQEDEAIEVVEREFSQLRTQFTKLKAKGPIVLTGDFNAKIKIMKNEVKQETSRNGKMLEDMLNQLDLTPVSVKSEHGTWTRELRTSDKQKSVIDYIIIRKSEERSITENIVDENGTLRLRGEKESDHNTLALTMKWETPTETKSIKRWNINNKEGWVKFNQAVQKMDLEKLTNYNKIERELRNIMEETIGSTTVTAGKKRKNKDSDEIKKLKMERKNKRKKFQEAITKNENKKEKLTSYIECQKKLQEKIEGEEKTRTKQIMKKIIEEGGTKSNTFWKMRRKAAGKKGTSKYLTITEEGQVLEDPEEAKRYIADYYENLYQAREGKPEYAKWTQEITNTVEKIKNSEDMQKHCHIHITRRTKASNQETKTRKSLWTWRNAQRNLHRSPTPDTENLPDHTQQNSHEQEHTQTVETRPNIQVI